MINRDEVYNRFRNISQLKEGWDSYGSPTPSPLAFAQSKRVASSCLDKHIPIRTIIPLADGGIGIIASSEDERSVDIECFNNGEMFIEYCGKNCDYKRYKVKNSQFNEYLDKIHKFIKS